MRLSPVEILKHLGFNVPEEGVEINPNDAYLHTQALSLLGKSITVDAISDDKLKALRSVMAGLVSAWTGEPDVPPNEDSVKKTRFLIAHILRNTYGQANENPLN